MSLFIADALTLINDIVTQKDTHQKVISKELQVPELKDRQIMINGEVLDTVNNFNLESQDYESSIPYEEQWHEKVLITDRDENCSIIVSSETFDGIKISQFKQHPITRKALDQCDIHVMIPIQQNARAFVGIKINACVQLVQFFQLNISNSACINYQGFENMNDTASDTSDDENQLTEAIFLEKKYLKTMNNQLEIDYA